MSPAGKKSELLSWRHLRPLGVKSPSADLSPSFQKEKNLVNPFLGI